MSSSTPYLILRFEWEDAQNNYMSMLAIAYADILADDLIVGRCIYDDIGTTLNTSFDLTRRSYNFLNRSKIESTYLRVTPTEPYSNQVTVSSGVLNSSKGNLLIAGGTFPVGGLSNTTNGRIDLVYVDENGAVQIIQGVDSSSPVAPRYGNRKVIAEIRRGASRNSIRGHEVFQVISSLDSSAITSDQLITDAGGLYVSSNVEDALQEIAGSNFIFKGDKTFSESIAVNAGLLKVAETLRGAVGVNIQDLQKNDGTLVQYVDQNGKLVNTVGADISFSDTGGVFTTDRYAEALNQIGNGVMTVKGVKTFESSPVIPTPTTNMQASTKLYVDTHAAVVSAGGLGHVKSGTDIAVDGSGNVSVNDNSHSHVSSNISDATSTASANMILRRDAVGRAKVVAPSAEDDIALKSNVTTVQSNLNTHAATAGNVGIGHVVSGSHVSVNASGQMTVLANTHTHVSSNISDATPSALASRILMRDAAGRAKVVAPSAADDIALLSTVTAHASDTQTHGVTGIIVGTENTQTLYNKTLVSPALGTPSGGNLVNCSFPTLNQSTTGNAATATYATNAGYAGSAGTASTAGYATNAGLAGVASTADLYRSYDILGGTGGSVRVLNYTETVYGTANPTAAERLAVQFFIEVPIGTYTLSWEQFEPFGSFTTRVNFFATGVTAQNFGQSAGWESHSLTFTTSAWFSDFSQIYLSLYSTGINGTFALRNIRLETTFLRNTLNFVRVKAQEYAQRPKAL